MYKTLDDLCKAIVDFTDKFQADEWPSLKDHTEVAYFRYLSKVYFDALNNPPEGVIGVGKITYAEKQLVLAQM